MEPPFSGDLAQLAVIAAGRQQPAFAILGQEYGQIAGRMGPVAVDGHHQVGDDMPELRSAGLKASEPPREFRNGRPSRMLAHRWAYQRAVFGEAVYYGVRVAQIERAGV